MVDRDVIAGVHGRGMAAVWLLYGCRMAAGCCMSAVFVFGRYFWNAHGVHDSNEVSVPLLIHCPFLIIKPKPK